MVFPPQHSITEKQHGRLETRSICASSKINCHLDFPYVGQVFCIHRIRENLTTGKINEETVYGITSLSPDKAAPERLLDLSRGQWTIENRLHYIRDVTFDEDRCRIRKYNGPHVMASIRNIVISLLRMAGARFIAPATRYCMRIGADVMRFLGIRL